MMMLGDNRISPLWMDYYALSMSQILFDCGKHNAKVTFHAFARHSPWSYFLATGQGIFLSWLDEWNLQSSDLGFLSSQKIFSEDFLNMLVKEPLNLTVEGVLEGEVAFIKEPIMRVTGPMWQCLLVEAALLNAMASQSSFATNAAQMCEAAAGQPVIDFGLRRAHSIGGLEAARAAYIGGCVGTSNLEAAKRYGIPPMGTCSHAFIMLYEKEIESFRDYARATRSASPVFLIDTYDTRKGIFNAISACKELGIELGGVRIDSGDLQYLSIFAREALTKAGFQNAKIIASNNLNAETIVQIRQDSGVTAWGIGNNIATLKASVELVYKLGAVHENGAVRPVMKFSNDREKMTLPGELSLLRFIDGSGQYLNDCIVPAGIEQGRIISVSQANYEVKKVFDKNAKRCVMLKTLFQHGKRVVQEEGLEVIKKRAADSLCKLHSAHKRIINPHRYVVGVERSLLQLQKNMFNW